MHDSDRQNATVDTPLGVVADMETCTSRQCSGEIDFQALTIRAEPDFSDKFALPWHIPEKAVSEYQISRQTADNDGQRDSWLEESTLNSSYKFKCSEDHIHAGPEDGDNSGLQQGEDYGEPCKHPTGTGENQSSTTGHEDDQSLNLEQILERYCQHPTIRMKPKSTRESYAYDFKRFARYIQIDRYSRRQLAGRKGKRLLLEHIATLPLRSRRPVLSGLASVWKFGVNLPWPIDAEADIGKLPKVRRDLTPQDSVVKVWYENLLHETNPYLRTLWLLIAQFGLRPHTVARLRWSHVRYDEHGIPCEIRANGADEGFKTFADLACNLPPDVADALVRLRKWSSDSNDADPILPWMNGWGTVKHSLQASRKLYVKHWDRLRKKYELPKLRMKDMRHWVASQCRDSGLSEQARAYMQGHEQPVANMGDVYDNRSVELNLARQAEKLLRGPLGIFERVDLEVVATLPSDLMTVLMGYHDGKVGFTEVLNRLDAWRLKANMEVVKLDG
jgi:integrase